MYVIVDSVIFECVGRETIQGGVIIDRDSLRRVGHVGFVSFMLPNGTAASLADVTVHGRHSGDWDRIADGIALTVAPEGPSACLRWRFSPNVRTGRFGSPVGTPGTPSASSRSSSGGRHGSGRPWSGAIPPR